MSLLRFTNADDLSTARPCQGDYSGVDHSRFSTRLGQAKGKQVNLRRQTVKNRFSASQEINDLWKRKALEVYEQKAAAHYATQREQKPGRRWQLEIALQMLQADKGEVLDIGCANGLVAQALYSRGFSVVGVDFSAEMIRHARRRFARAGRVQFYLADAERLPFLDGSFDYVLCLGVLEYLYDYGRAVAEIARVLRRGGVVVLSVPSRISPYYLAHRIATPVYRFAKRLLGLRERLQSGPITREYSFQDHWNPCFPWRLRQLLRSQGLEPDQDSYSNFFIFPLDRMWPVANDRLAGVLEACRKVPLVRWTASQYLVSARKHPSCRA